MGLHARQMARHNFSLKSEPWYWDDTTSRGCKCFMVRQDAMHPFTNQYICIMEV